MGPLAGVAGEGVLLNIVRLHFLIHKEGPVHLPPGAGALDMK